MASKSPIKLKTETEHLLYKAYTEEKAENDNLRHIIQKMQAQIDELQQQVRIFTQQKEEVAKTNTEATPKQSSSEHVEYSTDEEELAKETEWIRVKTRRNKKRKLSTSPTQTEQSVQNENNPTSKPKVKRVPPPPPIIVDGVKNYQAFFDILSGKQSVETFMTKIMNGNCVKINALNEDAYKSLIKILSESEYSWHSYENKQQRPIRVMVKNLHFTCIPERIIDDLQKRGFKIEDAANKLSWKKKEPLNMFMLTFNNAEDINKIYALKSILGCKVEVHPIKTSRLVPQCKRCQAYGHTQKYCSKEPRCVKCTGKHFTQECKRPTDEKPKCVHCGEPHPANYRGCIVAKEIQQIKNNATKKTSIAKRQQIDHQPIQSKNEQLRTYAQATAGKQSTVSNSAIMPSRGELGAKLDEILKIMSSFDGRLRQLENGTKVSTTKKSQK